MSAVVPPPVRLSSPDGGRGPASRRVAVVVLVTAAVALVVSVVASPWIVRQLSGSGPSAEPSVGRFAGVGGPGGPGRAGGPGMMSGGVAPGGMMGGRAGMMPGRVWLAGDGVAVTSIAAARARATAAASASGLRPGEIVQFSRNIYVELKDSSGASVTEVVVDPASGAVTTEPGPAMMWNTGSRTARVTADQARSIAGTWLQRNRPAETVTSVDAYPGYYTLDTAAADRPVGMLSVNATTGAVWYHTWHGTFVAKEDA